MLYSIVFKGNPTPPQPPLTKPLQLPPSPPPKPSLLPSPPHSKEDKGELRVLLPLNLSTPSPPLNLEGVIPFHQP